MSDQINLKEIERRAFRSTYEDGLLDLYLGLVVVGLSIFAYKPTGGYSPVNIVLAVLGISVAGGLYRAGKKFITLPRMGQVRFGAARKRKATTLAIVLSAVVAIQVAVLGFTALAWANPEARAQTNSFLTDRGLMDLAVAVLGSLFVGPSMILVAYFSGIPRGYYIAVMMALAVFLMIYLNEPLYPIVIGALIVLPGLVLLVRFLSKYPLPREEVPHE
jgi:hypothetical protein